MAVYGNTVLRRSINNESDYVSVDEYTSIVYNEYLNYKSLLESCIDESDKAILETKLDVLCEVSIKDIKETIIRAIRKIIEFIKDQFNKIKNLFTNTKKKQLQKEVDELKKKVNEFERENGDLKVDLDKTKSQFQSANKRAMDAEKEKEEYRNKYYDTMNIVDAKDLKIMSMAGKMQGQEIASAVVQTALENIGKKVDNVMKSVVTNPVLYFDLHDFLRKDIDPHRFVNSSDFSALFSMGDRSDKSVEIRIEGIAEKMNPLSDEFNKYLSSNNVTLSDGGWNHYEVNRYIKEFLAEKAKKNTISDMDKLINRLEWVVDGYQVSACNEIMGKYNKLALELQRIIDRGFSSNELTVEQANKTMMDMKSIIKIIDDSVRVLSVLSNFAGKAVGLAEQTVVVLKGLMEKVPDLEK